MAEILNFDFAYLDDYNPGDPVEHLLDLIRSLPQNVPLMINMPRYVETLKAVAIIRRVAIQECPDAECEMEYDGLTGTSLCFRVKVDEFGVDDTSKFAEALEIADTMDVIPLADGRVKLGFTFERVRVPMPPPRQ